MSKKVVKTQGAPSAIGPYSQAIRWDHFLFCSGQIGLDPATGELVAGGAQEQALRVLQNLQAVLAAEGLGLGDVVKTTVFLVNMSDFTSVNEIYAKHFTGEYPARSTVEVSALPKGALVEIEAVAAFG